MPYPPNVNPNDPRAPWNDNRPRCPICEELISDGSEHEDDCEWLHMDMTDIHEQQEIEAAERKMDREREMR